MSEEFRIELRGTPTKQADCTRPTSSSYLVVPRTSAETYSNSKRRANAIRLLAFTGARMLAQLIVLGLLLSLPAAAADKLSCDVSTKTGVTCSCDVRTLRPLQGAIGLEEVRAKEQKIAAHPKREWRDLQDDPIKVIRGPCNELYITDHHHGADAWRLAGKPIALCEIGKGPAFNTDAEFWSGSPGEIGQCRREMAGAGTVASEPQTHARRPLSQPGLARAQERWVLPLGNEAKGIRRVCLGGLAARAKKAAGR